MIHLYGNRCFFLYISGGETWVTVTHLPLKNLSPRENTMAAADAANVLIGRTVRKTITSSIVVAVVVVVAVVAVVVVVVVLLLLLFLL